MPIIAKMMARPSDRDGLMQQLGFRSVFAKLFASVMLALILFAVAMVVLTQLVQDKDASIRSKVLATQILGQIDPFLHKLNTSDNQGNRLQSRFMLAVVKKSFDVFDESLQAKMGLYDRQGQLLMQTDNSDLPLMLPPPPSLLSRVFPSFAETSLTEQAQVQSSTGYTLLYESRLPPKKPLFSAALNLFTGTLLLLLIMAGVLWWIARTITWRINQMSQQMTQLGDGDFSVRVAARGSDEIASLARGFNQAAQKIEHLINANNLLLAHASHELRTPITRIRLQIEMMDMLTSALPADTKAQFDKRAQAINRDLSGLNDLVESILLVSRLDSGHALQQVEPLDLYDLVNQERQHYPEATLIGEHITIDGQSSMLTHLIRNLLNNAMLHGKPPVTILLYGVQTAEDADVIPECLLHSVLCNGLTDCNGVDAGSYDESAAMLLCGEPAHTSDHPSTSTSEVAVTPAAPFYKNGESLVVDSEAVVADTPKNDAPAAAQHSDHLYFGWATTKNLTAHHDLLKRMDTHSAADNSFHHVIWHAVSEDTPTKRSQGTPSGDAKDHTQNHLEPQSTPRKEGLFAKHIKKAKAGGTQPSPKYAVLAVIDEGTGIPEDKREEVFSPFVRLQQKNKGSGLGLSLVSQIVTAHQGCIITDTLNGHTRFLAILPVKHNPHYHQPH